MGWQNSSEENNTPTFLLLLLFYYSSEIYTQQNIKKGKELIRPELCLYYKIILQILSKVVSALLSFLIALYISCLQTAMSFHVL